MSTPETTAELAAQPGARTHRQRTLHQPWRLIVALVELVLVAGLVLLAVWCWHNGVVRINYTVDAYSTRYLGSWIAGAIGLCVLAGFLLLDFFRELWLGIRARPRRKPDPLLADDNTL